MYRNPNEHHRQDPVLLASKERNRFRSVTWDEYDSVHQKYLEIGMKFVSIQKLAYFDNSLLNILLMFSSLCYLYLTKKNNHLNGGLIRGSNKMHGKSCETIDNTKSIQQSATHRHETSH